MPGWDQFLDLILGILNSLYTLTGNYGFAIILLTIAMRIVLAPVAWKQTKSMFELQRIQPKIKELQAKYKNDKEKLQEETLKFYQENKVNPFGSCLPLIVQMPIFIGLFNVLTRKLPAAIQQLPAAEQEAAKAFSVILPNLLLSPKDAFGNGLLYALPYILFALGFALSTYLPTALMPGEKQTKQTALYMSLFMLYIGWISPGGVLLYWVTSSVWQIAQQQLTLYWISRAEGAK